MKTARMAYCVLTAAILVACVGCASPELTGGRTEVVRAKGVAFVEEASRDVGIPALNWDTVVEATGQGLPASEATTPALKKLTAQEAAKYVALAQLVAKIEGTHITQESKVRDMKFAGQDVVAQLSGNLVGVKVVSESYDEENEVAEATVRVGLDSKGNIVPDRLLPVTPLSIAARKARAEEAAKLDALAKVREKVGEVYVGQEVRVKNLMLSHQRAWLVVEGMLDGVEFSRPRWVSGRQVEVEATLTVAPTDLQRLRAMVQPIH